MFNLFLLSIIIFLLIILSWVWPPDSPWAPWWKTSKGTARAVCRLAGISSKDTVYELGCGDAGMLIVASREFGARGVGIEIDPMRHIIAQLMVKLKGVSHKIKLIKCDFKHENLRPATIVFVYLVPNAIKRLLPKFKKELKRGTKIISFRYPIKELKLSREDKENKLFLYKIP